MDKNILKKISVIMSTFLLVSLIFICGCGTKKETEKVEVHIGYQSVTAQTWGALIIKNQGLFEKKLEELYPNAEVVVVWHDDISGAVINNNMIAGKYQIGYMGDMPCLINGYNSFTKDNYNSKCIAIDGRGKNGANQDVVVPLDSECNSIRDLEGKTISTPIGSSAHRMLLKVLKDNNMIDKVEIVHQDINVANTLLLNNEVDAFSVWAPYGEYLVANKYAKKIVDGVESEEDYLTGIIIDEDWGNENTQILEAFKECIKESHEYICSDPEAAAKIFEEESGFPYEVCKKMAEGIEWDDCIYERDIETFKNGLKFLNDLDIIKEYDCSSFFASK